MLRWNGCGEYVDEEVSAGDGKADSFVFARCVGEAGSICAEAGGAHVAAEFAVTVFIVIVARKSSSRHKIPSHERGSIVMVEFAADFPTFECQIDLAMVFAGGAGVLRGDVCYRMRRASTCRERAAA